MRHDIDVFDVYTHDVDVYNVARRIIENNGKDAINEVRQKIKHYASIEDFSSVKVLYEVEDAVHEIMQFSKSEEVAGG